MILDKLPQTWSEKLSTYKLGEERIYIYKTEDQVKQVKHVIEHLKKHDMFFRIRISRSRFSIIRDK